VRVLDLVPPQEELPGEQIFVGSFTDPAILAAALPGADLVVHLGGHSKEKPWDDIVSTNIAGTHTLLDAAHTVGIRRVLLASSIHAVGFTRSDQSALTPTPAARPDSFYGVGKIAVEALGSVYADRYGMMIISARIGTADLAVKDPRMLATWLAPSDAARLFEAALQWGEPGHHIIWGVSNNRPGWFDLRPGRDIGYEPVEDAWVHAPNSIRLGFDKLMSQPQLLGGVLATPAYPLGAPWV